MIIGCTPIAWTTEATPNKYVRKFDMIMELLSVE